MTSFNKKHLRIVPHLDSSPNSLVFNIIERDLFSDTVIKIGRFTDRFYNLDRITFKSKVVSRGHAEIWVENDQVCKKIHKKLRHFIILFKTDTIMYSIIFVIQSLLLVHL